MIGPLAFGVSCREHGIDWLASEHAVSMQIVRDPANTTPEKTGRLCFVCNSRNPTDRTAQNAYALWQAAVALGDHGDEAIRYLDGHYWTNAVMHGASGERIKSLNRARHCCVGVLRDQINSLSPKLIIASGADAVKSLNELGLVKVRWRELRDTFPQGAYRELAVLDDGSEVMIYCTYHTSAGVVNRTVARWYTCDTEELIAEKLRRLPDRSVADRFLNRHQPRSASGRGMRVLLLHWLDIGETIRRLFQ